MLPTDPCPVITAVCCQMGFINSANNGALLSCSKTINPQQKAAIAKPNRKTTSRALSLCQLASARVAESNSTQTAITLGSVEPNGKGTIAITAPRHTAAKMSVRSIVALFAKAAPGLCRDFGITHF